MLMLIANVVYVLLAIAMVALILMQRGAGAAAGAGFGGGASATVFGSRGASSFLSKGTKWLAVAFFGISMGMAWYATHSAVRTTPDQQDLGVMAQQPAAPQPVPSSGGAGRATPASGDVTVPTAPAQQPAVMPDSIVPEAPKPDAPKPDAPKPDATQGDAPTSAAPADKTPASSQPDAAKSTQAAPREAPKPPAGG